MGFRVLIPRIVCLATLASIVLAGCGPGAPVQSVGADTLHASGTPVDRSGPSSPAADPTSPSCSTDEWQPPALEIRQAFERLQEVLGQTAVLAPRLLPSESTLADGGAGEQGGARGCVSVTIAQGTVDFLQVIQGDLGDLPSTEVTLGDNRAAAVYQLLDGVLVQWEEEGAWYGVYGVGLNTEQLLAIARLTKPL